MSDEAEIQKWERYAIAPTRISRPVLNNGLLVGTINNILKERGRSLIKLSEIHDPSDEEVKTSTELIKSLLGKIKIPKITQIENAHEKVNEAHDEITEITSDGKYNENFIELINELTEFTKNSFPAISIIYFQKKIKKWIFFDAIQHILRIKFTFIDYIYIYNLESTNFNNLIANFFNHEAIKNNIKKMLNTYEFFEFSYDDRYIGFAHTIFVYVDNKDKHIIGDFSYTKTIDDLQNRIERSIEEKTLKYNFEKNNNNHKMYLVALYEFMILTPIVNLGYTQEDLPVIQEGPVCIFWMFFRMVFYNLTREQLIEKLGIAASTIGFEPSTRSIEAIIVVMVQEMLRNPEIKQQDKIADSKTGFGLNRNY